jgi:hypothetical protein
MNGWDYKDALVDFFETNLVNAHDREAVEDIINSFVLCYGNNQRTMDTLHEALTNKYPDYLPILEKLLLLV